MSLVQETISKHQSLLTTIGEAGLNALYPLDFEFYLVALELVNSSNETIDYFAFPVSPSSLSQNNPSLTNVKKTAGGVVSLSTPSFVPKQIQIRGNFGRKFRILLKNNIKINFTAFNFSTAFKKATFDPNIKSGYGAIKYLEAILDKSNATDENGNSLKLFFYNPILGNNYIVELVEFEINENMETNRIPGYNLTLKAIAPLESISSIDVQKSMVKILSSTLLQKGANSIANNIRKGLA
jgi:hypothetical protein